MSFDRAATSSSLVLLSVLAERRLERGQSAELAALIADVLEPQLERIGALAADDFLGVKERKGLAAVLNTLLHSDNKARLLKPRWAMSYLRGPMLQSELRRALGRGRLRRVA